MDDKLRLIGVGIVVGVFIAWGLFKVLGAEPNVISIGPVEFELPTATPIIRYSEGSNNILESSNETQSTSATCVGVATALPHRSPVVGEPWILPDGGWLIVNFWSNEPGIDQKEHKLLLSPNDPRAFFGGGSAWQWSDECQDVAQDNLSTNPLPEISLDELKAQNLVR